MSIQGFSCVYIGIHGYSGVFIGLHRYTGVFMGDYTWVTIWYLNMNYLPRKCSVGDNS